MDKETLSSSVLALVFLILVFIFDNTYAKVFCAFAAGVNFEAFMVAWRVKRNEPPL